MYRLYSQRMQKTVLENNFEYYTIPTEFIQQYLYIASDFFCSLPKPCGESHRYWEYLCKVYCREKGYQLIGGQYGNYAQELAEYLEHNRCNAESVLDIVELTFSNEIIPSIPVSALSFINAIKEIKIFEDIARVKEQYINELNQRFRQHNLGYEMINGQIVRKDSELLVKETITPAFALLRDKRFSSAEDEMQKAFRFRRAGDNAEAILNATKAFESVMKVICSEMRYEYDADKDTAKNLIAHLEKNAFYPPLMNNHIANIQKTLDSALPTVRNKKSAHGAGTASTYISDAFADYALHLAATNIVFLVDLFNEKKLKHKGN